MVEVGGVLETAHVQVAEVSTLQGPPLGCVKYFTGLFLRKLFLDVACVRDFGWLDI